ncbi:hypothetical protein CLV92_11313 [Kineococcus xinjiangensis]|uniref:Uncharacterized protein n=1 Tax=Kineococcus xinjiangensis TaxID=512762 RepID=A0A2S6IED2_9ACTN|nr:hypothetical protein [Kineococcus xinjiangensis]PPK92584.1 hypothetical protein CLV92_11313 [Kineococcus xinjiangensis]
MSEESPAPARSSLLRALRRAQLLREREEAALRRRLRGLRPRPPQSMPVPRTAQRPAPRDDDTGAGAATGTG